MTLFDLAKEYRAAKDARLEADARAEELKQLEKELEEKLVAEMETSETSEFAVDGTKFIYSTKITANCPVANRESLIKALKRKGFGDIVKPTINAQTLTAFVKEQADEAGNLPEWIGKLVTTFVVKSIGMRKATK